MSGSPEIRPAHWAKPGPKPKPFSNDRCGSPAGYKRHITKRVPICDRCRKANTKAHREWAERTGRAA